MTAMWHVDSLDDWLAGFTCLFVRFVLSLVGIALIVLAVVPIEAWAIPPEANRYKREYVRIMHSEWGLDAPIAALAAQIHQESAWDCRAVSRVGAKGCAQFMPATAAWIGDVSPGLKDADVFSPAWAFRAQAAYMEWLHARIRASDQCNRMAFALAAYNGGLGYVYKRQKLSREPGVCLGPGATCSINPGILDANQRENQHYPERILRTLEPQYDTWGPRAC